MDNIYNTNVSEFHQRRFSEPRLDPNFLNLVETRDQDGRLLGEIGAALPSFDPAQVKELRVKAEGHQPDMIYYHIEQLLLRGQVRILVEGEQTKREYEYIADYIAGEMRGHDAGTPDGRRMIEQHQAQLIGVIDLLDGYDQARLATRLQDISRDAGVPVDVDKLEKIRRERQREIDQDRWQAQYSRILEEAQRMMPEEGRNYLQNELKKLKTGAHTLEFTRRTSPLTIAELEAHMARQPEVLHTGYELGHGSHDEPTPIDIPAGALTIVAGSTGHGKTTFLINLLLRLQARYQGKRFYLLTYEEPSQALLVKILNTYQGESISANNRRSLQGYVKNEAKYVREDMLQHLEQKYLEFGELVANGWINVVDVDDTSDKLKEFIELLGDRDDTGAVLIDYIQLVRPGGDTRYNTRQEELKRVCIELKEAAVSTGLPVILGAQFNRSVSSPYDMEPTRIGEAGDIERIANLILGLYNNTYPPNDEKVKDRLEEDGKHKPHTMYLEILKNRDGVSGSWDTLPYNGNTGRIDENVQHIKP